MRQKTVYSLLMAGALCTSSVVAQSTANVTLDHTVKRYLQNSSTGEKVSTLDREKYFTIHEDTRAVNDTELKDFMEQYGVGYGRSFEGPLRSLANAVSDSGPEVNALLNGMSEADFEVNTLTPHATRKWVMCDKSESGFINSDFPAELAGRYVAKYLSDNYRDLADGAQLAPEFFEPLNEPFIRASDIASGSIGGGSEASLSSDEVVTLLSEYHKYVGKYIKESPALTGVKVVGYGGAYPSFEVNSSSAFSNWNNGMGKFMDIAHQYMDGYSIHIYDGINQTGESSLRSGSNSEAILDMIEAYSYKLEGVVKPHLTSEYGGIDQYSEDKTRYSAETSDLNIGSMNHILYNLLDRQDNVLFSVIFITGKATWYITEANNYETYAAVLLKRIESQIGTPYVATNTTWENTGKINLYELWKGVQGDRIEMTSDNPDVQVAAFKSGNTLYVTLSNLDENQQTVKLSSGLDNIASVNRRQLKVAFGVGVNYDETTMVGLPSEVVLDPDESHVYVVELNADTNYTNELTRTKYYQSSRFLEKAEGTANYTFNVTDLESGYGTANIRMTLGDNSITSLSNVMAMFPTSIKVNDKSVAIPTNWRGYNQVPRGSFLGMIDVPFDISNLVEGANTVSFTFPAVSDGYLASVVLEVETYKNAIPESTILNGSFESSDLSAWTPWGVLGDAELSSDNASFGSCLQLEGYAGVLQSFELEAGTEYVYTFEAKCEAGSTLTITLTDGDTVTDTQTITATEYSADPYTATFTPLTTSGKVTISLESGKAWVDTMSLIIPSTDTLD